MSPAARARESAGLSLEQAAEQARICVDYLKRIERHGGASYVLGERLSRIYRCSANLFIKPGRQTRPKRNKREIAPSPGA